MRWTGSAVRAGRWGGHITFARGSRAALELALREAVAPGRNDIGTEHMLPGLLRSGVLRLHALRLDGAIIATLYALADRPGRGDRRAYFYLGGFDPDCAALSPGALILGHAIEAAVREGAVAFDFLRGQEAYKLRWGARDTPTSCRRLRHGMGAGTDR